MSPRSDTPHQPQPTEAGLRTASDPMRPGDHVDAAPRAPQNADLGFTGWLRWGWRQLTSMRTALVLLLLLAVASVPGSLFPQRSSDPNGVSQAFSEDPSGAAIADAFQLYDVYGSIWFSAIYLLLFVSLIGCIIPRTKHHWQALRAEPPRTPVRGLERLDSYTQRELPASTVTPGEAIALGAEQLRNSGYRIRLVDDGPHMGPSVSAERGYLRETGNLVFHASLIGVLIGVGLGGGFSYTGQAVVVEGETFANTLSDFDSFNPGRWVASDALPPYTITLDTFNVDYVDPFEGNLDAIGQATDYRADVSVRQQNGSTTSGSIKVNEPLHVDGTDVYLLGNGYAVDVTVSDPDGVPVFQDTIPFLPQDRNFTSLGVIKVPDGLAQQVGMIGFLYPTQGVIQATGAYASLYPDLTKPVVTLQVYGGDLGVDTGTPVNVYSLDTSTLTQLAGRNAAAKSLELTPGSTAELPDGLGSITVNEIKRYAALEVHSAPGQIWVLVFALLAVAGLLASLFIPRRRVWIIADARDEGGLRLRYAGLARGEDPGLEKAVAHVADAHIAALQAPESAGGAPAGRG